MKGMDRTSLPSRLTDGLARKRSGRRVRDALLLVLVVFVGASVGLLVLLAAAAATAVPALFLLAGLAAFCGCSCGASLPVS
jgi:hypothetical protein